MDRRAVRPLAGAGRLARGGVGVLERARRRQRLGRFRFLRCGRDQRPGRWDQHRQRHLEPAGVRAARPRAEQRHHLLGAAQAGRRFVGVAVRRRLFDSQAVRRGQLQRRPVRERQLQLPRRRELPLVDGHLERDGAGLVHDRHARAVGRLGGRLGAGRHGRALLNLDRAEHRPRQGHGPVGAGGQRSAAPALDGDADVGRQRRRHVRQL
jgi:hypothetical protein